MIITAWKLSAIEPYKASIDSMRVPSKTRLALQKLPALVQNGVLNTDLYQPFHRVHGTMEYHKLSCRNCWHLYIMMGWKQIYIDQFHRVHDTMEEVPWKTICLVHRGRLKTTARDSWLGLKSAFLANCWQKLIDCSNRSASLIWHCVFVTGSDTSTSCNSSCVSWSFTVWQCLQQIYMKLSTDPMIPWNHKWICRNCRHLCA